MKAMFTEDIHVNSGVRLQAQMSGGEGGGTNVKDGGDFKPLKN